MKNSLEHPILWQKRNEWQIDDDPQTDWQQMQGLLDTHMPVSNPNVSGGSAGNGLTGITTAKLLSALFIALSAAAIIYFAVKHYKTNSSIPVKHKTEQSTNNSQPRNWGTTPNNTMDNNSVSATSNGTTINTPSGNNATDKGNNTPGTVTGKNGLATTTRPGDAEDNYANTGANRKYRNMASANARTGINSGTPAVASNPVAISNLNKKAHADKINGVSSHRNLTTANGNLPGSKYTADSHNIVKTKADARPLNDASLHNAANRYNYNGINSNNTSANKNEAKTHYHNKAGSSPSTFGATAYVNNGPRNRHRVGSQNHINQSNRQLSLQTATRQTVLDKNSAAYIPGTVNQPQYYGQPMDVITPAFAADKNILFTTVATCINPKPIRITAPITVPAKKIKNSKPARLELGILAGVNAPGSFTGKSQNANFYGSWPVDAFWGIFVNYNIYKNWGLNIQPKMLSPQTVSGTYSHIAESKIDSGKIFAVTDSRKIYFVDIPLHIEYRATPNIRLMFGSAISFPVKETNASSLLAPNPALKDSAYYVKVRSTIGATKYSTQPNFSLSGGVGFNYGRLFFNATYLKALKPQSVTSDLGGYTFNHNALQFSIGLRLK